MEAQVSPESGLQEKVQPAYIWNPHKQIMKTLEQVSRYFGAVPNETKQYSDQPLMLTGLDPIEFWVDSRYQFMQFHSHYRFFIADFFVTRS